MRHTSSGSTFYLPPYGAVLSAIGLAVSAFVVSSWLSPAMPPAYLLAMQSLMIAPLIEETFFRGVVQSWLRSRGGTFGGPWPAIVVTACCFGVAHLAQSAPGHSALVVLPALAIGWAFERTRSIPLCIAFHSVANAAWLTYWSL